MKAFQLRAARAILKLGVREVALGAGVTPATITRFETERGGLQMASLEKLQGFFEKEGIIFLNEGDSATGGPGVRLRKAATGQFGISE